MPFVKKGSCANPTACLGDDVEVQLLHYAAENEAVEKWSSRVERVCGDDSQLFFKFCDRMDALRATRSLTKPSRAVCSRQAPNLRSAVFQAWMRARCRMG